MTMLFSRNEKSSEANGADYQSTPDFDEMDAEVSTPMPEREPIEVKKTSAYSMQSIVRPAQRGSVISKAMKITGQLESTEDIEIDGVVDGDVHALSVKVGANARVNGAVYGDAVEVAGTVDGKIEAKKVMLTATARVSGDIVHEEIAIQSGAFVDGHCRPQHGKTDSKKAAA
jgi:cytoskeletal protein CcmA (bactofilin family)